MTALICKRRLHYIISVDTGTYTMRLSFYLCMLLSALCATLLHLLQWEPKEPKRQVSKPLYLQLPAVLVEHGNDSATFSTRIELKKKF